MESAEAARQCLAVASCSNVAMSCRLREVTRCTSVTGARNWSGHLDGVRGGLDWTGLGRQTCDRWMPIRIVHKHITSWLAIRLWPRVAPQCCNSSYFVDVPCHAMQDKARLVR